MSSMGISLYSIKPQFLLILLIIIILATSNYLIWSGCVTKFQITSYPNKIQMYQSNYLMSDKKCETIHIGIVCIGTRTNLLFYTLLKSLYFYRTNPLHFHILADNLSEISINTLFDTWSVSQVSLSLYNANEHILNVSWIGTRHYSGVYGLLKLIFPNIVPTYVSKLIILDSDIVFNGNIIELWLLFNNFNQSQFIGLTENESGFYLSKQVIHWPAVGRGFNTGIILYDLWRMRTISWNDMWYQIAKNGSSTYGPTLLADQDVINAIVKRHREILFEIPCYWNIQLSDNTHSSECYKINFLKVIHWNSPKKTEVINKDGDYFKGIYNRFTEFNGNSLRIPLNYCSTLLTTHKTLRKSQNVCQKFQQMESKKWRTLLLFKIFEYIYVDEDVTYMAHFSYDRLYVLEELLQLWQGPMSLVLYATDSEFQQVIHFLSNVETLKDRKNIGFHVVFRSGEYYPINYLRNIGLKYVYTTYVFLADIDFLPMPNLYSTLRQHIANIQNMNKKALIVPAFESQKYRSRLPRNKRELLYMLKTKEVFPFRYDTWSSGHSATNYTRWKTAHTSYQIKWLSDFEPYVLVSSNVTEYDTIFMGFGWNKVSHIMELHLQGYEFIVLPDVFIIHQPHTPSNDIVRFRRSSKYRR